MIDLVQEPNELDPAHAFEGGVEALCVNPGCYAATGNPSALSPCPLPRAAADHLDGDTGAPVLVGAPGPILDADEARALLSSSPSPHMSTPDPLALADRAEALSASLRSRSACAAAAARVLDAPDRGSVVEAGASAILDALDIELPLQAAVELEAQIGAALERWAADLLRLAEGATVGGAAR